MTEPTEIECREEPDLFVVALREKPVMHPGNSMENSNGAVGAIKRPRFAPVPCILCLLEYYVI